MFPKQAIRSIQKRESQKKALRVNPPPSPPQGLNRGYFPNKLAEIS